MNVPPLHKSLRKSAAGGFPPVRPVVNPEKRALVLLAFVPVMVFVLLAAMGLRHDAATLGPMMTWGPLVLQTGLGLLLVATGLVLTIPGRATGRGLPLSLLATGLLAFLSQTFATHSVSAGPAATPTTTAPGSACMAVETLVGIASLTLVVVLARSLSPSRVLWPCVLAAAGTGLIGEGIYRLHCSISDPAHVLLWHGGSILVLIAAASTAGKVWERTESRRMAERIARRRS
ncbi:MAG: DUF1109 family protein [Acidobacteria bacterium]|nr:DUF1109 family protein [Acidobacteriota bacterium]